MITNLAQLIEAFIKTERSLLDKEKINHAPTIGSMYEGLAKEAINKAIPADIGLKIVDGFVEGHDGSLSPQMDAMLVVGEAGTRVPFTEHFRWPIEDVLAVFEVKKTLHGAELVDAVAKSVAIGNLQVAAIIADAVSEPSIEASNRAFARLKGYFPDRRSLDDPEKLDGWLLRVIVADQIAPLRIVLGYDGYVDETSLRGGFMDQLERKLGEGWSPIGLPNLIICRGSSLLKMNGHPYICPTEDEWWPLIASEREAPFRLMIELIWTRLASRFEAVLPMDDSLVEEQFARLLLTRLIKKGDRRGWEYSSHEPDLRKVDFGPATEWSPQLVTKAEDFLIRTAMLEGGLDTADENLAAYCASQGYPLQISIDSLVERRILACTGTSTVVPLTVSGTTSITPDGRIWWATNPDLLSLWIARRAWAEGNRVDS